jgi:precorrin-3B methylase
MMTGINAEILMGYTGYDHLIDSADETNATSAVAGVEFRRASDALAAAEKGFLSACDRRVESAKVRVVLRTHRGDVITVG